MATIDAGSFYVTTGTISGDTITGGTTVRIDTTKVDYNFDNNELTILPMPTSKGNRSGASQTDKEKTTIVNLLRVKIIISIQGMLIDDSTDSSLAKKNNLITLAELGHGVSIVWGKTTIADDQTESKQQKYEYNSSTGYGAFVQKMMVTETAGQYTDGTKVIPEKKFDVQISFVIGTEG